MKKFIGYYIIGAANKKEAENEKGLMLWSQVKPSFIKRIFNKFLLGIYWVNKEKILEKKQDSVRSPDIAHTEMSRFKPVKKKKNEHTNQG
jgi:hypothetical protein